MYEIDMKYLGIENILLIVAMILVILLVRYIRKINFLSSKIGFNSIAMAKVLLSIVLGIIIIINVFSIGQRVYIISCYKNHDYCEVSGVVEDMSYIMANNSNIIIGIQFKINDVDFKINKGVMDYGYSINDGDIISEGEYVNICYMDCNTILRIDTYPEI